MRRSCISISYQIMASSQIVDVQLVAASAAPTVARNIDDHHVGNAASTSEKELAVAGVTDSSATSEHDGQEHDIEDPQDGIFRQYIEKNGLRVLISWTKDQESRVVRKADFLFLPVFVVS